MVIVHMYVVSMWHLLVSKALSCVLSCIVSCGSSRRRQDCGSPTFVNENKEDRKFGCLVQSRAVYHWLRPLMPTFDVLFKCLPTFLMVSDECAQVPLTLMVAWGWIVLHTFGNYRSISRDVAIQAREAGCNLLSSTAEP